MAKRTRPNEEGRTVAGLAETVPVGEVILHPAQPRPHIEHASLCALCESMQRDGLIHRLVVRRLPSGKYELLSGVRTAGE